MTNAPFAKHEIVHPSLLASSTRSTRSTCRRWFKFQFRHAFTSCCFCCYRKTTFEKTVNSLSPGWDTCWLSRAFSAKHVAVPFSAWHRTGSPNIFSFSHRCKTWVFHVLQYCMPRPTAANWCPALPQFRAIHQYTKTPKTYISDSRPPVRWLQLESNARTAWCHW